VNGNRYLLSGKKLPAFREYFEKYVGVDVSEASPPQTIAEMLKKIPEPIICQSFLDELKQMGEPYKFISFDPENRLLHSHGHSCQEIYQLRHGKFVRLVDVVIYPSCHSDVEKIVKAAQNHPVCIIPYGGGTTVSQSLMCPENEERMIISLDMKEMNSIKWIDFEVRTRSSIHLPSIE
jgi:alkyldihydroxyacetonephosphate synthase